MRDVIIAITAASHSGNKGAAAMLRSSICQLKERYGERIQINLMSVYPREDRKQLDDSHIKVISTKPEELVFIAFPLAILYHLFHFIPVIKKLFLKNKILKAYTETDLVIDEAGVSFVDSRGFVMNTYAFICAAVPMLIGVPVVKYAQAMGSFQNPYNRFLARLVLPKMRFIAARGQNTFDHLSGIGVRDNVKICADGAFSLPDDVSCAARVQEQCEADAFFKSPNLIGLSISSVVRKKCEANHKDYVGSMVQLIDLLNQQGYPVLIIANAARIHSVKARNNDLMTCDEIYARVRQRDLVRWYHEEMRPEEIREWISHCRFLIASRFHAMIFALERKVPVLLIGWSHKYQEVLDMFELGNYSIDYSKMTVDAILTKFEELKRDESSIREKLNTHHSAIISSSKENIHEIGSILDDIVSKNCRKSRLFDLNHPDLYLGNHIATRMGFASAPYDRVLVASGGMVTSILIDQLRSGKIDGAWVSQAVFEGGKPTCKTFIATTEQEIRDCGSSVYMSFPQLKHLHLLESFEGKVAVVMTPCIMNAFNRILEKNPELKQKVALRIGLYCSSNGRAQATELAIKKAGVPTENANRLYYRRGHWRGKSVIRYEDGSERTFSYTKTICALRNAFFFLNHSCLQCKDQFATTADLSFGDIWLKSMKKNPIKHNSCIVYTERGMEALSSAEDHHCIQTEYISDIDLLRSQKRALVFKFNHEGDYSRWNHKLAYSLAKANLRFSEVHSKQLEKIPMSVIYYYMCFIRFLLSF